MSLRLRIHQTAPRLAEVTGNLAEMDALLAEAPAGSLVVFPELAHTGYDLGVRARELALEASAPPPLRPSGPGVTAVWGFPEVAGDGRLYNAAGAVDASGWIHRHRKRYLPTYGMFDEARTFAPGVQGPHIFHPHPSWPTALLICEELWHPGLAYLAALRGAHLLLILAAAPGRGSPRDPEEDGTRFGSHGAWRLLARTAALTHGMYVALANRCGAEGGVVFAGGSMVVGPDGTVLAEASHAEPDTLDVVLDLDAVRSARTPYAHIRDEDPSLMIRELEDIVRTDTATR